MSINNIYNAPVSQLKELNNLFIELTEKNCNQRCKHCYIDFPMTKNVKDFISVDKVKQSLDQTMDEKIECIYLMGAEPMTHPDFNTILRLCLKHANVCIFTNGSFINEKKARFLKKVEDENEHEIIFKLSADHFDEIKSDDLRGRGAFRQVLHAIKSLIKYDFNPIICITNYYNEDKKVLVSEFKKVCNNIGFEAQDHNFKINEYYNKYKPISDYKGEFKNLDCQSGRVLTQKGVYVCPFLANDHRGRMGADFTDYGKKMYLETDFCATCAKNKEKMFSIDYRLFI